MWLKYIIITLLFLVFSLIQNSFLQYFNIFGSLPNLIFILFFILAFFDPKEAFFTAIIAGILTDLFLPSYFGVAILSFFSIFIFMNLVGYLLQKFPEKNLVSYFLALFSASFALYSLLMHFASIIFGFGFPFDVGFLIGLIYNLVFAIVGFYIYIKFIGLEKNNQLKLFS